MGLYSLWNRSKPTPRTINLDNHNNKKTNLKGTSPKLLAVRSSTTTTSCCCCWLWLQLLLVHRRDDLGSEWDCQMSSVYSCYCHLLSEWTASFAAAGMMMMMDRHHFWCCHGDVVVGGGGGDAHTDACCHLLGSCRSQPNVGGADMPGRPCLMFLYMAGPRTVLHLQYCITRYYIRFITHKTIRTDTKREMVDGKRAKSRACKHATSRFQFTSLFVQ